MTDLRDYTSLRVGGPATKFVEVHTETEIIKALDDAGDSPVLILGGGTNVLISDAGFAGTVIHIVNSALVSDCLLYTSPSPRDGATSRMPSSA